ncbi:gluconate 2-dehydrogenase subunit 3 family protein [Paenibacillus sp. J2TS4]|uniref:gluconate 2-dehydrogenase subunit 3 family protein n=1 Tax=Paenibacillus sp. J2TS4 TaxID=2807194 RepID=UPI001B14922B|nr:gluconate 2-dehydrogenase subunit 3 family protein [Paenibacillus sp. J2TS4]GIP34290.1 hypothetical protein J2TS4_35000 [Paenibacillus sp. J2TS4]
MTQQSHYPTYDVMQEKEHWDDHTRSIVEERLKPNLEYSYLSLQDAETLRAVCSTLIDDNRNECIRYVLTHIDGQLHQNIGEGQRKSIVPPLRELVRRTVEALDLMSMSRWESLFHQLKEDDQRQILLELSENRAEPAYVWTGLPQAEIFNKLLTLTVEAYYSHPLVWSEIGYGGPAYPRGYVRTAIGQLDPWEAKTER